MKNLNKFLPETPINGKCGWYPVCNEKEWNLLPKVFKSMSWYPVKVYNERFQNTEEVYPEYIVFDVVYMRPYKIRAKVKVHIQETQKIMMCYFDNPDCHLYTISSVVFTNGVEWHAKWHQDTRTGAFAIYSGGRLVGQQGGFMCHVPENIKETKDGFVWEGPSHKTRTFYEVSNPFEGL